MMRVIRALPPDEWRTLRALVFGTGLLLVLLAASGVFESTLFSQPSNLKYAVTVGGSALLVGLATVRAPLRFLVGLAIIAAPFDFVTTFSGMQVTPILAVDLLAVLVALPRRGGGTAALRPVSVIFALLVLPAIVTSNGVGHWVLWLTVTVLTGWVTFLVAREPGGPFFVAGMVTASALVQGGLAIWEFRSGHQLNLYQASGTAATAGNYFFNYGGVIRASGTLPDPIGLGQVLALCLPVAVALAASLRQWSASLVVLCAAGVAGLGLVLSLSRMSIVGGSVGLIVVLLLLPQGARLRAWAGTGMIVALVTVIALSFGGRQLRTRINSIVHPTASHVSTAAGDLSRVHIWNAAIKTGEGHLVAGVGFGNITNYLPRYGVPVTASAHAHDTYLQFFAEGGVLGLLAVLAVVAASFRDLLRAFAACRTWVAGAAGALVATLIAWSTDVEVRYVQVSVMVAVLLGLVAALSVHATSEPVVSASSQP